MQELTLNQRLPQYNSSWMHMRVHLGQTIEFIEAAVRALAKEGLWERSPYFFDHHYMWHRSPNSPSLESTQEVLFQLEAMATKLNREHDHEALVAEEPDARFPMYTEVVEVTPVYRDAISLECRRPTVKPAEIPHLLYLLKIPGHIEGLDVENHGFGYHFHYGRIKAGSLSRTNLLLTFSPSETPKKRAKPPLYYEYHADGKTKSIDAEALGLNKRRPIYLVCHDVGQKRGLVNFKHPSANSKVFFDDHAVAA
jgi:hypothetical protein